MTTGNARPDFPQALVFDLGGVLMRFDGVAELSALTGLSSLEVAGRLNAFEPMIAMETGELDGLAFGEALSALFNLKLNPEEALALWAQWERGPIPGALDIVRELRRQWPVHCLSNISPVHWQRMAQRDGLVELFDRKFLSYEIGLHKPDPALFAYVARELELAPEHIVYFDDRQDIVDVARQCGLNAHCVQGPDRIPQIVADITQLDGQATARNLVLRDARPSDLGTLRHWDSLPHIIESDPDDDWQWETELFRNPPWREQLIAEVDGKAIGFLQIIDPALEDSHYWGQVAQDLRAIDIWIGEPDYLGRGFGTLMMQEALARCFAESDVTAVLIDPLASNTRAQRFYRRIGFEFLERRQFGPSDCYVHKLTRERYESVTCNL